MNSFHTNYKAEKNMDAVFYQSEISLLMSTCASLATLIPEEQERNKAKQPRTRPLKDLDRTVKKIQETTQKTLIEKSTVIQKNPNKRTDEKESPSLAMDKCAFCLRAPIVSDKAADSTLKTCGCCKKIFYCCKECQSRDWPQHKKVCHK
jgi:hypothetical protein